MDNKLNTGRTQSGSKLWSKEKLSEQILNLENKSNTTIDAPKFLLYILSPYIASLGYNIFNIEEVDIQVAYEKVVIQVCEEFSTVISLEEYFPTENEAKVFVAIEPKERVMSLYVKALGDWELLHVTHLNKKTDTHNDKEYDNILNYLAKKDVVETYARKQERMFTEGVLRSKLNKKEMDNAFVREVIREELKNPSRKFLQVIAEGLANKFSSEPIQNLTKSIEPLSESGVVELMEGVISDIKSLDKKKHGFIESIQESKENQEIDNLLKLDKIENDIIDTSQKEDIVYDEVSEEVQEDFEDIEIPLDLDIDGDFEEETEQIIFDEEQSENKSTDDIQDIFEVDVEDEKDNTSKKESAKLEDIFGLD